jgi:hypothetical protein
MKSFVYGFEGRGPRRDAAGTACGRMPQPRIGRLPRAAAETDCCEPQQARGRGAAAGRPSYKENCGEPQQARFGVWDLEFWD